MKIAVRLFLTLLLLGMGFTAGFWTFTQKPEATLPGDAIPLAFGPFEPCVEANTDEMALFSLAVQALETVQGNLNSLGIGAEKFLGQGFIRNSKEETIHVCDLPEIYERAGRVISQYRTFDQGRLVEYELQLANRIKAPTPYIVKAIAKSAFNPSPQISYIYEHEDIRPLARSVLAGFRDHASEYSDIAYEQMSANDSLGTSAAQIAAATGHPLALDRIEKMMADSLAAVPKGGLVPWKTKRRLYELAYAFVLVGDGSKPHLGPLRQLMAMKVESWAPPFGLVEHPPKRMCQLLAQIEGDNSIGAYPYCIDDKIPYDQ